MKAYELLFFVDPSLDPETRLAVMKRIDTTIAEGAGKVDSVDEWGKRKLAYEINDLTDGDYTLINFHADPTQIAELDRVLRIRRRCGPPHDRPSRRPGVRLSFWTGLVPQEEVVSYEHQSSEHHR